MGRIRLLPLVLLALAIFLGSTLLAPGFAKTPSKHGLGRFYGVGLSRAARASEFAQMRQGGIGAVRIVVEWRTVQPNRLLPYNWGPVDSAVSKAAAQNITVLPQVLGTPAWLSDNFTTPPTFSPEASRLWRKFLAAAVQRYGDNGTFWKTNPTLPYHPITTWEIWNEENSPGFWSPKPNPKDYAKFLKESAHAIRRTDSQAKIMLGGMFQSTGTRGAIFSWKFIDALYKLGAAPDFDVVGVHPYAPDIKGYAFQIEKMRAAMRKHHDGSTPIWIDEIGWGSARSGGSLSLGPKGQAAMLRRAFHFTLEHRHALNVRRIYWYPWRDTKHVPASCKFCQTTGLLRRAGKPKPSWHAYQSFSR